MKGRQAKVQGTEDRHPPKGHCLGTRCTAQNFKRERERETMRIGVRSDTHGGGGHNDTGGGRGTGGGGGGVAQGLGI